jgi:selenium metabolism protein YedF
MKHTVDARGLACPLPVINTRKALELHNSLITIVDNQTAVENIRRMAGGLGCTVSEEKKDSDTYITITKSGNAQPAPGDQSSDANSCAPAGPRVLVISQDVMGKGDDDLGRILIKSLFHTLAETKPVPDVIIFFNSGVTLVAEGSEVLDDIRVLEQNGVRILSCGTCLDFFKIKEKLRAGTVSNMYDIKELMLSASSTINL